ncbi:-like sensor kinase protein [Stylonychia lemnae]|uniref:-like sensor kinase protein n=1 Tax=Stylonychia lemnae TaxID=5949 RepID=A0A078AXK1_STYLE|nr:-like sensor kinase protein [Stylonychia lemnae]|eukprot:CDW86801.1 -like sensor kinase protein [Stylonychia lemnae]
MKSLFTLSFIDSELLKLYMTTRQRDVVKISLIIWLSMTYKFQKTVDFHAPLLVMTQIYNLYQVGTSNAKTDNIALVNNIVGFNFFMLSGLLTSSKWYYTAVGFASSMLATILFYSLFVGIEEVPTLMQFVVTTSIVAYSSYMIEYRTKMELLQIVQVKRMNEELQGILMNFPEGIILYSQDNGEVILANKEMKRIFKCQSDQNEKNLVKQKINQNLLLPVNLLNQQQQLATEGKELMRSQQKVSMITAAQNYEEGQCFQMDEILNPIRESNPVFETFQGSNINQDMSQDNSQELITIKESKILYESKNLSMIMVKCMTPLMRYEKLKLENHFYEMLTATVSHDMRTPLNAMCGLLSNIEPFIVYEVGQKLLRIVKSSSKILLFLVNDLLDFQQIKNGKFRKNEMPCNIKDTINEAIEIIKLAIEEKGLTLNFHIENNIPEELVTDSQRINQILLNLLQNALKFTHKGEINLFIKYDAVYNKLFFTVKDQGIGIKHEDRKKLFTLFGKLESTASINTSGIGLGLNICKMIVESFGGQIYIEDNKGESGTSFTFTIQCKGDISNVDFVSYLNTQRSNTSQNILFTNIDQDLIDHCQVGLEIEKYMNQEKCDVSIDSENYSSVRKLTDVEVYQPSIRQLKLEKIQQCPCQQRQDILVVDDNIFNVVTLQTILEFQFNLKSDKAMNGLDALKKVEERINLQQDSPCFCKLQRKNYKLIFMDCNMPVMDGFQATEQIRLLQNQTDVKIKIIALTAYTTDNFKIKSSEAGMDSFITKPIQCEIIKALLIQDGFIQN